jgi:ATP-binding cassette subfamily B protein
MGRLWGYLARYRVRYLAGIVCLVVATTLTMTVPWLFRDAVNTIGAGGSLEHLVRILALVAAIAVVQGVLRTMSRSIIFNVGRDIEYDLRNDLFAHLERLPLAYFQQHRTGDLMSRLVNDVTAVRMLLGPGVLNFINTPVYYVYGLAIMLSIHPGLTLAALSAYPIALLVVKRTSRALIERSLRVQEGLAEMSSRIQENLSGIHVVKAYASEEREVRSFAVLNDRFQEHSLRLARLRGIIVPVMSIAGGVGSLVVLWYGGRLVVAGRLTVGDLVAFIGYLHVLAWPTAAMGWMLTILQRGRAAMKRLNEVLAVVPAITSPPDAVAPGAVRGELALRGVTFRYPGRAGTPAIDDVSVTIPAGRTVAVVGRTGAGKTSLVQLLPRLFDVDSGSVLIDGRDVRTLPLGWLRRTVGIVPQDPFLFSRSIRDNVGFGLENGTDRVDWAVRKAGLGRDVADMPAGLDTLVGERGVTLSGGQKQRLALARVLATAPRVIVLDDTLSSVDAATEREILDGLRGFFGERTTVIVAHRITTVKEADLVVVLDGGRVVEMGSHDDLLATGRVYPQLFREQALESELEAI